MTQSASIPFRSSLIEYIFCGAGRKILFCLHGYEETAMAFTLLGASLREEFFMIAIDLPFHGGTCWLERSALTVTDLHEIISSIREKHGRMEGMLTLTGHSLGARTALSFLQAYPRYVDKVLLLSPEGLAMNLPFRGATGTALGSRLFSRFVEHPGWFMALIRTAQWLGLLDATAYAFIYGHTKTEGQRKKLYLRWMALRHFRPDVARVTSIVQDRKIALYILLGNSDMIVNNKAAIRLAKEIGCLCRVESADCGHRVLHSRQLPLITRLLTN